MKIATHLSPRGRTVASLCVAALVLITVLAHVHRRRFVGGPLPAHPFVARNWAASIPGVDEVRLVGVGEPGKSKAEWWGPDGNRPAQVCAEGGAPYLDRSAWNVPSGHVIRVYRLEFASGMPKELNALARTGNGDEPSVISMNMYAGSGPTSRLLDLAFTSDEVDATADLYVGLAAGKGRFLASQGWHLGWTYAAGPGTALGTKLVDVPNPPGGKQFLVATRSPLSDGRLNLTAEDAEGKAIDVLPAGSTEGDPFREFTSMQAGRVDRVFAFSLSGYDATRVAKIRLFWVPFRWIEFEDVVLRPH